MSGKDDKEEDLIAAQVALVGLYQQVAKAGRRVIIVLEGRDAAGKDGTIRRITENLPTRPVRAVSLPAPNERDRVSWYFQRYIVQFPAGGEIVIFNRSWYNRAGVEPVMGFCTPEQTEHFLQIVPRFEALLVDDGFELLKYYLDISREEQKQRLAERAQDPLKVWKIGPLDSKAMEKFEAYSEARDKMLLRTHAGQTPWTIVRGDKKPKARLAIIRDIVARLAPDQSGKAGPVDPEVLRPFDAAALSNGFLSR
jgi:polyphosphate kinase 2